MLVPKYRSGGLLVAQLLVFACTGESELSGHSQQSRPATALPEPTQQPQDAEPITPNHASDSSERSSAKLVIKVVDGKNHPAQHTIEVGQVLQLHAWLIPLQGSDKKDVTGTVKWELDPKWSGNDARFELVSSSGDRVDIEARQAGEQSVSATMDDLTAALTLVAVDGASESPASSPTPAPIFAPQKVKSELMVSTCETYAPDAASAAAACLNPSPNNSSAYRLSQTCERAGLHDGPKTLTLAPSQQGCTPGSHAWACEYTAPCVP